MQSLFYKDGAPVPVRYVDKKRIQSWLNVNRVQFPLHNLGSDSTIKLPQNDTERQEQKSDCDYSRAVKRDDMAAAARMVDEAANAALSESQARVNGKLLHLIVRIPAYEKTPNHICGWVFGRG